MNAFKNLTPEGTSTFNEAYVYGIGLMLKFNEVYIQNEGISAPRPSYLHIVIGSDV